ncbi:MAG: hypothetical protein ACO3N6_04840 [bacterium]
MTVFQLGWSANQGKHQVSAEGRDRGCSRLLQRLAGSLMPTMLERSVKWLGKIIIYQNNQIICCKQAFCHQEVKT